MTEGAEQKSETHTSNDVSKLSTVKSLYQRESKITPASNHVEESQTFGDEINETLRSMEKLAKKVEPHVATIKVTVPTEIKLDLKQTQKDSLEVDQPVISQYARPRGLIGKHPVVFKSETTDEGITNPFEVLENEP